MWPNKNGAEHLTAVAPNRSSAMWSGSRSCASVASVVSQK